MVGAPGDVAMDRASVQADFLRDAQGVLGPPSPCYFLAEVGGEACHGFLFLLNKPKLEAEGVRPFIKVWRSRMTRPAFPSGNQVCVGLHFPGNVDLQ